MFYLHLSNRTENLITQLAEVLSLDEDRDPFSPEFFLIQSQGMERMLSQSLATRFTSWCNYEYMLPTRFFALLADRLGVESGPEDYTREKLSWYLEKILRTVSGEAFAILNRYVTSDSSGMKRYQLARQLAYVFDQYQIMRLAMIDGWEQGRLSSKKKNPAERYQMNLWNLLRREIGHSRHRGVFLRDLIKLLQGNDSLSVILPKRLSIFGLHSLPPILLSCLQALASHCEVHFYLLSPCENYWTDQLTRKAQLRKNISIHHPGKQGETMKPAGHPLLSSLGQQGREFQEMLLQDAEFAHEFQSFTDPFDMEAPCLLHKLQSDLLRGEVTATGTPLAKDDSLIVVSAHSPQREMMILKDRLLHWLDKEPELALRDIVVMAPDIQEYSALIPAVFHDIPHSVADRNPAQSNTSIAVFLQFLNLCSSRFGWNEVLDLLERKEVYPRFEIQESELELVRHWVLSSGIRWGLSASQWKKMGLPAREECTWQSGLDRLMMGYAVGGTGAVNNILPYRDIEGGMAAPLGGLSLFCEILEQAYNEFAELHSLTEWAEILADYVDRIFAEDGGNDLHELRNILTDLGLDYGPQHQAPLGFEVIRSWVEDAATEKKSSSGFLRGQLTFCSMLPMRSIPFQKVCLLGLNDTVFPKNDHHPPFDLLGDEFLRGDRSRRSDDRYQFLEAILSARTSLYLSYVGQSIRNNDELPPSVVVSELVEFCQRYGPRELVNRHPLHGFSEKYFPGDSELFSYNNQLLAVAKELRQIVPEPGPWWQGSLVDEQIPEEIHLFDMFAFFSNPQKYFVRNVLGIHVDKNVQELDEHEPFVLDSLQKYLVEQDLVIAALQGEEKKYLRQQFQVAGQWPLGTPGVIAFEEKLDEQHPFITRIMAQMEIMREDDCFVDLQLGGVNLTGTLTSLYANGSFLFRYSRLKCRDIFTAWIHHCLALLCTGKKRATRLLAKDTEICFPAESGSKEDLEILLALFLKGQQTPSPLLLEPVMAFARQQEKTEKGGKGVPLEKAVADYQKSLEQGYEPEWELLYQGQDSNTVMGQEFVDICHWFYGSVWSHATLREV
ncbi:MAG: exodeoxyribonuclease V subunit gamma [Desulfocapsa sp.]|nr:exodeoxyribonuclease V subunit gamma [Desulfocapsa sp.]